MVYFTLSVTVPSYTRRRSRGGEQSFVSITPLHARKHWMEARATNGAAETSFFIIEYYGVGSNGNIRKVRWHGGKE